MSPPVPPLSWLLLVILSVLAVTLAVALWRVVRGPSGPDRVVALDLIAGVSVGAIAVFTVLSGQPVLLRVAMGLALISFLGTVAVARYLEKSVPR